MLWSRGKTGVDGEELLQRSGTWPDILKNEDLDPADYVYWSNEHMVIAQRRADLTSPCCGEDGWDCHWSLWLSDPGWKFHSWERFAANVKDGGFPGCDLPLLGRAEQRWEAGEDHYIYTHITSSSS